MTKSFTSAPSHWCCTHSPLLDSLRRTPLELPEPVCAHTKKSQALALTTYTPGLDSVIGQSSCGTSNTVDDILADQMRLYSVTLYTPLTPFTVLFTHVIHDHENGRVDLQLLNDFVESLKPARHVSNTIDRFHSLCSKFCQIAEAYVSAKSQEAVMTEFDNYLSTLGLLPQPISQGNGLEMDPIASSLPPHTYQDWYSGNVGLYGLIDQETDFANLDSHFELEQ